MNKILELRAKRAHLWNDTKAFLESHRGQDSLLPEEYEPVYAKMCADVIALGHEIQRLEQQACIDRQLDELSQLADPSRTYHPSTAPVDAAGDLDPDVTAPGSPHASTASELSTASTATAATSALAHARLHTHTAHVLLSVLLDNYFSDAAPNIPALRHDWDRITALLSDAAQHVKLADRITLATHNRLDEQNVATAAH